MSREIKVYDTTLRDGTQGEGVSFSMEDKVRIAQRLDALGIHYIDGFKKNREYALRTLRAAESAGAHCLVLCDTNGGGLPHEIVEIIREVKKHVKAETPLGIHVHNDTECAVANTLAAVSEGVNHVQGTVNGYG